MNKSYKLLVLASLLIACPQYSQARKGAASREHVRTAEVAGRIAGFIQELKGITLDNPQQALDQLRDLRDRPKGIAETFKRMGPHNMEQDSTLRGLLTAANDTITTAEGLIATRRGWLESEIAHRMRADLELKKARLREIALQQAKLERERTESERAGKAREERREREKKVRLEADRRRLKEVQRLAAQRKMLTDPNRRTILAILRWGLEQGMAGADHPLRADYISLRDEHVNQINAMLKQIWDKTEPELARAELWLKQADEVLGIFPEGNYFRLSRELIGRHSALVESYQALQAAFSRINPTTGAGLADLQRAVTSVKDAQDRVDLAELQKAGLGDWGQSAIERDKKYETVVFKAKIAIDALEKQERIRQRAAGI